MLYYINLIFFYSLLGFILESVVYKISNTNEHSSIFYGPYTLVYGFGMLFCILFHKLFNFPNIFFSYMFYFLIFTILTTTTEFIAGHIINYFLKIDKWNYSKHKYHFGKYICLDYAIYWGLISLFINFKLHPFFDYHILKNIPETTTIIILLFFTIDLIFLIKNKIVRK